MENNIIEPNRKQTAAPVLTADLFLGYWQGHRRLTRKVIVAFPEDKFYTYSVGGMRPFAEMVMEVIGLTAPGIHGIATGEWKTDRKPALNSYTRAPETKQKVLDLWDWVTEQIDTLWPQISPDRFQKIDVAFGQYEGPVHFIAMYLVDNEIHHRSQAYVYLRSLGIEPPAFWDRN